MSWLNNFFEKAPESSPKTTAKRASRAPRDREDSAGQQTLHLLLSECPQITSTTPTYDLKEHPNMQKEAQVRLNRHIKSIPPMPEIWDEIQDILQQPDSSASDLGQCVARDPVLTAKVLAVCNSAAYGSSSKAEISNIPLAIARLGLQESSNLIFQTLAPNLTTDENQHQIRHIWFHAQAIATLSRLLAEPARIVDRSEASLNGMLHDIGKLVILHLESSAKLGQLGTAIRDGMDSLTAEHAILGYTHIDAGMMLALRWRLPIKVREFIGHHHDPGQMDITTTPVSDAAMVTHLAHLILQQCVYHKPEGGGRHLAGPPAHISPREPPANTRTP